MTSRDQLPRIDGPAIYRIRVQGHIDPSWSTYFGGLNVTRAGEPASPETVLVGRLTDQSVLAGILDTLHQQHQPVVSVECLEVG